MKTTDTSKSQQFGGGRAIVSDHVKDYSNHPYFVKKVEEMMKVIDKYGLPDFNKK